MLRYFLLVAACVLAGSAVAAPVCDGTTDDTAALQAMWADPLQPVITLIGGVCLHHVALTASTKKDIDLRGATLKFVQTSGVAPIGSLEFAPGSNGSTIRNGVISHDNGFLAGDCGAIVSVAADRITLDRIEIDGNLAAQNAGLVCSGVVLAIGVADFAMMNGYVHDVAGYGALGGAPGPGGGANKGVWITGNRFARWRNASGIRLNMIGTMADVGHWFIKNNHFDQTGSPGGMESVGIFGSSPTQLASVVQITGNTFKSTINSGASPPIQHGIQARYLMNFDVSGNYFEGGTHAISADAYNFTYSHNTFLCQYYWAIEMDGEGVVNGNRIDGCGFGWFGIGWDGPGFNDRISITNNNIIRVKDACVLIVHAPGANAVVNSNNCVMANPAAGICYNYSGVLAAPTSVGNRCNNL